MNKKPEDKLPDAKQVSKAFLTLAFAVLVYPICIGLILWMWWKGYHWGWGALTLAALLILDPIWIGLLAQMLRRRK